MNRFLVLLVAASSLCFVGCRGAGDSRPKTEISDPGVAGGYSEASVKDSGVIRAATFAVSAQAKAAPGKTLLLEKIVAAQQQVVAGLNYRLTLRIRENGTSRKAEAIVWWQSWNTAEPYRLTSWTWK